MARPASTSRGVLLGVFIGLLLSTFLGSLLSLTSNENGSIALQNGYLGRFLNMNVDVASVPRRRIKEEDNFDHEDSLAFNDFDEDEAEENEADVKHEEELENEHEAKEELIEKEIEVSAVIVIVIFLIIMTILFEKTKEFIEEEHADKNMRPMIESLFGEMTVLGFLSLFTFLVTKTGTFEAIGNKFFEEEGELVEIFEFVHFCLFFIMVGFVVQVLILVHEARGTQKQWLKMDRECRANPEAPAEENDDHTGDCFTAMASLIPPWLRTPSKRLVTEDQMLFRKLRKEFILGRSVQPPFEPLPESKRVSEEFNFGLYLGESMGKLLAHVVEVQIQTWGFFALFSVLFYAFSIAVKENNVILAWTWTGVVWIIFLFNVFFEQHLLRVRKCFVSAQQAPLETSNENSGLLGHETGPLPEWCKLDLDGYLNNRWFYSTIFGLKATPTRQQALLWFERNGPKVYLLILQINLIFAGLYLALFILAFSPAMYNEVGTITFGVYLFISTLPLLGIALSKKHLVATLSQVCSIGWLSRPHVVSSVIRQEKTAQVVRTFLVLYRMRHFATNPPTHEHGAHPNPHRHGGFDELEMAQVGKTFDTFDTSKDGSISMDEFAHLMESLGGPMSPETLEEMVSMLDQDGDKRVTKDEFLTWYGEYMTSEEENSLKDHAHSIFEMFDKDGTGEISIEEFHTMLDALGAGFSVDDVGELVRELDENGNGMIGAHEFEELLEKYYPEELEGGEE